MMIKGRRKSWNAGSDKVLPAAELDSRPYGPISVCRQVSLLDVSGTGENSISLHEVHVLQLD